MLFKNVLLYRLRDRFKLPAEELQELLQKNLHSPCPKTEAFSIGWTSPFGYGDEILVYECQGYYLISVCKEEKILPAAVIREALFKQVTEVECRENRRLSRQEKLQIQETIIFDLRQRAFSRKKIIDAYIDSQQQWLIINTTSRQRAEELCTLLREALGSLQLALPETNHSPGNRMTDWLLRDAAVDCFQIMDNCDMLDPKQKTSLIRCRQHDLSSQEIVSHLQSGKLITQLAMSWQDRISFELCDDLSIKKVRFLDILQEQRKETHTESKKGQIDADFALMTGEFTNLLHDLWSVFGGLKALH
jgi:recombination associated protein RdgC